MPEKRKYVFRVACVNGHEQPQVSVVATSQNAATEKVALGELNGKFCPICRLTLIPTPLYSTNADVVSRR